LYIRAIKFKQLKLESMTTTNTFGQEVFTEGCDIATVLTFGIKEGFERMEKCIKNTWCKSDSDKIIEIVNCIK
jgi:hypothetical protein